MDLVGSGASWYQAPLSATDYESIMAGNHGTHWWDQPLEWQYNPQTYTFSLRVGRPVKDDALLRELMNLTMSRLRQLCLENPAAAPFVDCIQTRGPASRHMVAQGFKHDIEAQLKHKDASYPGVVFEVAFQRSKEDMEALAKAYILRGGGNIRRVMVLNHKQDRNSKKATVNVWKATFAESPDSPQPILSAEAELADLEFRTAEGGPNPGWGLAFPVANIAPPPLVPECLLGKAISITSQDLYHCLQEAELQESQWYSEGGVVDASLPPNLPL